LNSKKQLEIRLSRLKPLKSLKINLEQYPTPPDIAAEVLWISYMNKEIKGKIVADLGCGNGIFGIGALLLGAQKVYFLDSEGNAIMTTKQNLSLLKLKNFILLREEVHVFTEKVDLIIENPPFGVQKLHADREFLLAAMHYAKKIYSFHKIESKNFITALAKDNNFKVQDILTFTFPLKKSQDFHTKEKYGVDVGCFILTKT